LIHNDNTTKGGEAVKRTVKILSLIDQITDRSGIKFQRKTNYRQQTESEEKRSGDRIRRTEINRTGYTDKYPGEKGIEQSFEYFSGRHGTPPYENFVIFPA
jgi:hypothetical protein